MVQSSTSSHTEDVAESLLLQVGDYQAHYLRAGEGPPVVLLHGGASNCSDWLGTIANLSYSYSLYAPDMIGFGQSSRNGRGYNLSDFVEFTLEFIRTLGLDSPVLVGHSLGGRVCLEIALRHPETVSKLVLVSTAGFSRLTRLGYFLGTAYWAMRKTLRLPQPYPRFVWENGEDRDWLCLEGLSSLKTPTLIVWTRHDPYYPLSGALWAEKLIPVSYLEVFGGYGHAPHVKKSDLFSELLLSFVACE
ncbi:alpha/beta fold hydrolase [Chloroflexota bacterium]